MSNNMKVIMENWDRFVLREQDLPECNASPVDIDTFLEAIEFLMLSPEVQKEKIAKLKAQEETFAKADKIEKVAAVIAGVIDIGSLGATGGAATATVGIGSAFLALFANVVNAKQQKKTNNAVKQLLKVLCIDEALLDTVDNQIEKEYWTNSDLKDRVEEYIRRARATNERESMPDFTRHFVDWLNNDNKSPYSKTGTGGLDTDIVMRGS